MKRYAVVVLACAFALGGCVSASKYRDQEAKAKTSQQRADSLDKELAAAKKGLEAANAAAQKSADAAQKSDQDLRARLKAGADQLASLNTQMASVQKSNKDLQESLEANKGELTKKVAELIKEKDALSQKLAEASNAVAAREKAIAQAREEKAALEKAKAEEKKALEAAKEAELAKVKQSYEDLTASLKSEISAGEVTITQLKGKLTVNMVDRILFDSGQAEVRSDGKKVLEKVGKILSAVADKDIRIEGHTDNKPIVGDLKNKYATNWELSTARATAVLRYLQDIAKVDPKRLVAAGYGEFRPVAPNDAPEQRALNRRIEIVLVPRE